MNGVPDQFADLLFPMQGLDISVEFELQPPGTTDSGMNVRAYEPLAGRQRGGSRPGMVKYVDGLTAAGASVIQLLDTIVDPTVDALLASFDDPGFNGDTVILDPSTNNFAPVDDPYGGGASETGNPVGDGFTLARNPMRRIREGGSGIPPNRHRAGTGTVTPPPPPPPPPPGAIAFVQANSERFDSGGATQEVSFSLDVLAGSLIVVAVAASRHDVGNWKQVASVTDNQGTTYTQAGVTQAAPEDGTAQNNCVSLFYAIWNHLSGPCTITVDQSQSNQTTSGIRVNPDQTTIAVLEYSGVNATPLDAADGATHSGSLVSAFVAGTPTVSAAGDLLLAAVAPDGFNTTYTASDGWNSRVAVSCYDAGTGTNPGQDIFVTDTLPVSASTQATGGADATALYAAASATFKKA